MDDVRYNQSGWILENEALQLRLDGAGRVIGLRNLTTSSELLTACQQPQNWKLVLITDRYPVIHVWGSAQTPTKSRIDGTSAVFEYESVVADGTTIPIRVVFTANLVDAEAQFQIFVRNRSSHRIREVWTPVLYGHEGFTVDGITHTVDLVSPRNEAADVLHTTLPSQVYLFNSDVIRETALFTYPRTMKMPWIDLAAGDEGICLMSKDAGLMTTVFRLEKEPPEGGLEAPERHLFPADWPRYLNLITAWLTSVDEGDSWTSPVSVVLPHEGDWHRAADHYATWAEERFSWPERPSWVVRDMGWQHLLGKTDLDERFHTFEQYAEVMRKAIPQTGVTTLMTYGHETGGCESADFDIQPADDLGGSQGFAAMAAEVHALGGHVMAMTHRHQSIATDRPEYEHYRPWLVVDREGRPRTEIWPKTTLESFMPAMLRTYEATGPIWSRVCVFCDEWWDTYLTELQSLIHLGLDGIQMDLLVDEPVICYATSHGHRAGRPEEQLEKLGERLQWLRDAVHREDPEFVLAGEEVADWLFQYIDIAMSRYRSDAASRVFAYTLPELPEMVSIGAFGYDQVNKAFMLGKGFQIDVFTIKRPVTDTPEFAEYIGAVNRLRRTMLDHLGPDALFRDHEEIAVSGDVEFATHRSPTAQAVVLRNTHDDVRSCAVVAPEHHKMTVFTIADPDGRPLDIEHAIDVPPHGAALVLL